MTPQQARERLDELVNTRVAAAMVKHQEALAVAKRERLAWFYAGYDSGISDDPTVKDVEGIRFLTLEQRKVKAAAKYAIAQNSHLSPQQKNEVTESLEPASTTKEVPQKIKARSIKRKAITRKK
jgi:hypothetical protein